MSNLILEKWWQEEEKTKEVEFKYSFAIFLSGKVQDKNPALRLNG